MKKKRKYKIGQYVKVSFGDEKTVVFLAHQQITDLINDLDWIKRRLATPNEAKLYQLRR